MLRPTKYQATEDRAARIIATRYVPAALVALAVLFGSHTVVRASFFSWFDSAPQEDILPVQEAVNSQTIALLRPARNIDPNPSRGGGDVLVADNSALVAETGPAGDASSERSPAPRSDQIALYLVQPGDTLSQVADMFGVSVSTIVWANDLSSSKDIQPGRTLLILPISGVQHTIKKGDTLRSIAQEYDGNVDEILAYNALERDAALIAGTTITIPGGEVHEEVAAPKKNIPTQGGGKITTSAAGGLVHPVPGSVRTQGIHGYNGIDFGAPAGTPIRAAAGGTVIVSKVGAWNGGYGNYVVIDHPNGTQTLYAHMTTNAVWQGQKVTQGQTIGTVGNTGRSTGNHLHFEVRGAKNPF